MSVSLKRGWISSGAEPKASEEKTNNAGQTVLEALEYSRVFRVFFFTQSKILKQIVVKLCKTFSCGVWDYLTLMFALAFCF